MPKNEHQQRRDHNGQARGSNDEIATTISPAFDREPTLGPGHSEELYLTWHPFERASSEVDEPVLGAPDDVADRAADQHLPSTGLCADAGSDVYSDASQLGARFLNLAHVNAGTDLEALGPHLLGERAGAGNRISRMIEHGEEAIAGVIDFATPCPAKRSPDHGAICGQQVPPLAVADSGCQLGRRHDVGEEHGCQSPARAAGPGMHGRYSLLVGRATGRSRYSGGAE